MINERNFLDQPVSNKKDYGSIPKSASARRVDCKRDCLLGCNYLEDNYKIIIIDLSKEHVLNADPKTVQQSILLEV